MATMNESILTEYGGEIGEILDATNYDRDDPSAQMRVASALARFLRQARRKRSNACIHDCPMYKLAKVVTQARSQEEFVEMTKKALPYSWSTVLSTYNLDWKIPWDTEFASTHRGQRLPKEELVAVQQKIEDVEKTLKDLEGDIAGLVEDLGEPTAEAPEKGREEKLAGSGP